MEVKNQVQLITYPDSLGGDLKSLQHTISRYFPDVFKGGIHILPPFPSSGDRGFAPLTYFEIEEKFGTWGDIKELGEKYDILLDVMVNHISQRSEYFQDFLEKGRQSEYADMFITLDKLWEDGKPVQEDIDKMFLRRQKPYSAYQIKNTGETEYVWTTFGREDPSEQIDLDVHSEKVKQLLRDIFATFKKYNIKIVRLDAVGYVIKKLGTSCFFVEPEIYDYLDWVRDLASKYDITILLEVHAEFSTQLKLAERDFWIYDFVLPYTILESLMLKKSDKLRHYLTIRPYNQFTMLDCHDGIPVLPDLEGYIDIDEAKEVVDICVSRGSNLSRVISDEHKAEGGFDVHQIGGTYYSILDEDDDAYLAARAIQFFAPGVPQVYYVGLLAGTNDYEAVERTGEIRAINRHNYTFKEIEQDVRQEVVQRLVKLIHFRNEYPAFNGEFTVLDSASHEVKLSWKHEDKQCDLHIDLNTNKSVINYINDHGEWTEYIV